MISRINNILNIDYLKGCVTESQFLRMQMTLRVCFISTVFSIIFSFLMISLSLHKVGILVLGQPICYLGIIYLIHKNKFEIAKIAHTFTANWGIFVFSSICGVNTGIHLYALLGPIFVLSLYDLNQKRIITFSFFLYLFTCFASIKINISFLFPNVTEILTEQVSFYIYCMTLIFIIILSTNLISYILGLNTTFSQEILNNNITLVAKEKNLKEEIEQRKESENKLRTLFSELQLAYERVNQFSHMVSHNMRSPIANIKGLMNIINTHKISETEKKEYLHIILNCVDKLDKVIIDMNEILHIQHNINESKSIVDFQEELNSVLVIENQSLNDAGAKIISDFEKIPNIYTVKSFIHSILLNLVVNALKYKKPDKKPLIKITSYIHLDHIFLEVSDNGLGIDLVTHKDSIFLPYKQFHSHAYGKGLGLYLVNTQAQLLGGNVSVKSEIGKGTTFVVDLGKMD